MALTAADYDRLGLTAADALASQGTPLAESIDKIAAANDMNLEQLQRLCAAANNAAFKALFDKSAADDREVKFKVASVKDVVDLRGGAMKTAAAETPFDAAHELRPLASPRDALEKTASYEPYVDPREVARLEKTASDAQRQRSSEVARLREAVEAEQERALHKFAQDVDQIASYFRHLGPDLGPEALRSFEKQAADLHGDCGVVLRSIRARLPYGPLPDDAFDKFASYEPSNAPAGIHAAVGTALDSARRHEQAHLLLSQPGALDQAITSMYGALTPGF